MFIPIGDDIAHNRTPWVTYGLVGTCAAVFLLILDGTTPDFSALLEYGFSPDSLFGAGDDEHPLESLFRSYQKPPYITLFTSMFLHAGWLHLIGNMIYLWIFGRSVEQTMGYGRFLCFYLLCGIVSDIGFAALSPNSTIPAVGASGAISGVLGAYLMLMPRAFIHFIVLFPGVRSTIPLPAVIVLGLWIVGQIVDALQTNPAEPGVAFAAHVFGFAAGCVLIVPFRHKSVPLFGRTTLTQAPSTMEGAGPDLAPAPAPAPMPTPRPARTKPRPAKQNDGKWW